MLNAKINLNGINIDLTGSKEDIVYALRNTIPSAIPTEKSILNKASTVSNVMKPEKASKHSKEDSVRMYEYLASQGDYTIKQFEITRGGKINPVQYVVCLVFDNGKQRYCYYNPKSEDKFIQSFSIADVIGSINASQPGFSLLHSVANKIWDKISLVDGLKLVASGEPDRIAINKPPPFPQSQPVEFKTYDPKFLNKNTYRNAIEAALNKDEWQTPSQIWSKMVRVGFSSKGKTPDATISSLLYTDIKNNESTVFERAEGKSAFRLKK